ncbi:MAG: hypothetical protein PHQ35_10745 [Phycisphaerae bacterium]|nr:hypothetical protein [Phycisphaerae bacterium]MDD5382009.1 hypothetical protein [Phycisphaerae bacterium]
MTDSSPYQDRYWKEFFQLRVHVDYLELYMEQSEFIDKTINIFLGITSSSSICGWVIWQKYSFVWAVIIAISQLVGAIKQFLPYQTRLKAVSGILRDFEELLIIAEMKWFDVSEGNLTEEEINKLQFDIRSKKTKALRKHLEINTLPTKGKLLKKAKQLAETYIKNFYGV